MRRQMVTAVYNNVSNLQKGFTETRRGDVELSKKCSHASILSIWTEEIQAQNEEWTPQTAINCNTFWRQSSCTRNSSLANTKICMLLYYYCFVLLCVWGQFPSTIFSERGGGGLCHKFGAYIWRDLFLEFYGITVLRFLLNHPLGKFKDKT